MPCDERGFTLLELILVMLITTLSLAIITPSLQHQAGKMQLEGNARKMAWILRLNQQQAIYSGQDKMVRFYPAVNAYLAGDTFHYLEGAEYAALPNFPTQIGRVPACVFQPSGIPRAGGTVVLRNNRQDKSYVIVSPVAGRIRISADPPASW